MLPNGYEEIRRKVINDAMDSAGPITDGTIIDAVRDAVERCCTLATKPPKELTDGEIKAACDSIDFSSLVTADDYLYVVSRAAIAAHIRKQSELERVKFRAALFRFTGRVDMLNTQIEHGEGWEWLEPEQSFEVVLP